MLGGIAGQSGFDSKGKTVNTISGGTSSTTYADLVNVSGSGYLVSVFNNADGSTQGWVQIVIDGVTKHDYQMSYSASSGGFVLLCRFEASLIIRHKKVGTYASETMVVYLLD